MSCLRYSAEAKCPSFILFLFNINFPSTQTFSSDAEYFIWINVLLRRKWFSALFTRWDDSTNSERCGGRTSICVQGDMKFLNAFVWKAGFRVPPGLGHEPSTPNHPVPVKTPTASLQLDPGRDGNVMCQNTSLEGCPEAIQIQTISPLSLRSVPLHTNWFQGLQGQVTGVKLALDWKEKFDLVLFQNF